MIRYDTYNNIDNLVGKTVKAIYMDREILVFDTDQGKIGYGVEGVCCSISYLYDFHGVQKLLAGNQVVSTKYIDLETPTDEDAQKGDSVAAYGFEIVTHDPKYGDVTSVFSFRNDSNGYYGGSLHQLTEVDEIPTRQLTEDFLGE